MASTKTTSSKTCHGHSAKERTRERQKEGRDAQALGTKAQQGPGQEHGARRKSVGGNGGGGKQDLDSEVGAIGGDGYGPKGRGGDEVAGPVEGDGEEGLGEDRLHLSVVDEHRGSDRKGLLVHLERRDVDSERAMSMEREQGREEEEAGAITERRGGEKERSSMDHGQGAWTGVPLAPLGHVLHSTASPQAFPTTASSWFCFSSFSSLLCSAQ